MKIACHLSGHDSLWQNVFLAKCCLGCTDFRQARPMEAILKPIYQTDCSLRQGARHLKGTYKGYVFFSSYFRMLFVLLVNFYLFVSKLWFLSLSIQSHAESSRNFIKKSILDHLFSYVTHFSQTSSFFDLQTFCFNGKTVFFKFLAEIRFRTPIKSPQEASSRPKMCKFRTTCTLP